MPTVRARAAVRASVFMMSSPSARPARVKNSTLVSGGLTTRGFRVGRALRCRPGLRFCFWLWRWWCRPFCFERGGFGDDVFQQRAGLTAFDRTVRAPDVGIVGRENLVHV